MAQPSWRYRLTKEALIEEVEGRTRVYGRWDWQFGCWEIDATEGTWREVVPDWPVLDHHGVWLSPEAIRGPAGHPVHAAWRFEARAAYAAYFSLIPTQFRLEAASHGHEQWRTLASSAAASAHSRSSDRRSLFAALT